jgi:hypothetical protein
MTMVLGRLAMTPGDHGKRDSTEEQRKSAIQQKREFPEIITETEIFKGNAERPPNCGCGIRLNCGVRRAECHERSRDEENSQSALFPIHFAFLVGLKIKANHSCLLGCYRCLVREEFYVHF